MSENTEPGTNVPEGMPVPPYDPMNPMFGPTEVGMSASIEDTTSGPIALMGFRTSNCTFTVPLESSDEIGQLIDKLIEMQKEMKSREIRAQFQLPPGLLVPNGATEPIRRRAPRMPNRPPA